MLIRRTVAVAIAGLVMTSLLVVPAEGSPSKGTCPKFRPDPIETESERAKSIPEIPVVVVTDSASKKDPVVIEFEQRASAWWWAHSYGRGPIIDGNEYFNVQVDTRKRIAGLHARLEWDVAPADLDLYVLDRYGTLVGYSEAFNFAPAEATGDTGGPGYEYAAGVPARDCEGFIIEDNAMWTPPQSARLKLWLGRVEWAE